VNPLHAEDSVQLREWVATQSERLRRSAVGAIRNELRQRLLALPKTGPGSKGKRERLNAALRYLEMHQERLRYAELRRRDLDIGSGAVEGTVRNLVALRLDGPGMRWSRGTVPNAFCIDAASCSAVNGTSSCTTSPRSMRASRSHPNRCSVSPTPRPHEHARSRCHTTRKPGSAPKSILRSPYMRIAVPRTAPKTPPPGCWNGPTR
jgi:hypothetical protein